MFSYFLFFLFQIFFKVFFKVFQNLNLFYPNFYSKATSGTVFGKFFSGKKEGEVPTEEGKHMTPLLLVVSYTGCDWSSSLHSYLKGDTCN
jgi:hypothetical protein